MDGEGSLDATPERMTSRKSVPERESRNPEARLHHLSQEAHVSEGARKGKSRSEGGEKIRRARRIRDVARHHGFRVTPKTKQTARVSLACASRQMWSRTSGGYRRHGIELSLGNTTNTFPTTNITRSGFQRCKWCSGGVVFIQGGVC